MRTRRAAVLVLIGCALALALAVPLRTYLAQRQALNTTATTEAQLTAEVARLQTQKGQLADPAYIESEARARLGFVRPGETPYQVQLPAPVVAPVAPPVKAPASDAPWYSTLWHAVAGGGG